MRALVVSDIHANLPALESVLEDAGGHGFETIWCLGDTVGYGPEPDACIQTIRRSAALGVVGNHDVAVLGQMDIHEFNPEARRAVLWTRGHVSTENMRWLGALPSEPIEKAGVTLTHGSPRDPVWEYVLHPSTARANFDHFVTRLCLVGHTHVPAAYILRPSSDTLQVVTPAAGETVELDDSRRAILNPGSVGQPRDNDPRAAYALLDTESWTWQQLRVAYPIETTQNRMRSARLPERLINRLAFGW